MLNIGQTIELPLNENIHYLKLSVLKLSLRRLDNIRKNKVSFTSPHN